MRLLWIIAAVLMAAAVVSLFVSDNNNVTIMLVIAGSAVGLIDRYRERAREAGGS